MYIGLGTIVIIIVLILIFRSFFPMVMSKVCHNIANRLRSWQPAERS